MTSSSSKVKERPIIFSGEMVRAILAGRKTQTRRPINPQPVLNLDSIDDFDRICRDPDAEKLGYFSGNTPYRWNRKDRRGLDRTPCPFGKPGDRLWVRETWGYFTDPWEGIDWIPDRPFRPVTEIKFGNGYICNSNIIWAADGPFEWGVEDSAETVSRWNPSIHMPRWASRITLEVTGVRVQRLQEIGEEDAKAEGVDGPPYENGFWDVWSALYGYEAPLSIDANPWVWVVEFRRSQ